MTEPQGALRSIAWREIFPWLLLVDVFRLAKSLKMLLLGSMGVALTAAGWWALAWLFSGAPDEEIPQEWLRAYRSCPWSEGRGAGVVEARPGSPPAQGRGQPAASPEAPGGLSGPRAPERGAPLTVPQIDLELGTWDAMLLGEYSPVDAAAAPPRIGVYPITPTIGPWFELMGPFRQMLSAAGGYRRVTWVGFAFLLSCGLWVVAVWALVGGAMTRLAAVYLGREEKVGLRAALRFAAKKWWSFLGAPLLPLLGVFFASLPLLLAGLLMRWGVGLLITALAWPLALVLGLFMAVLLLALLFGWPLMWPAISAENGDSFEALNNCYAYVYRRPLEYLGYAIVATVLGILGWAVVWGVAEAVVYLTNWSASWASGGARMDDIRSAVAGSQSFRGAAGVGAWLLRVWEGFVRLAALGFVYSYFWSSVTGMYLLLRLREDGRELDEVFVAQSEPPRPLPPLVPDEAGVPTVPHVQPAPQVQASSPPGPAAEEMETPAGAAIGPEPAPAPAEDAAADAPAHTAAAPPHVADTSAPAADAPTGAPPQEGRGGQQQAAE